MKLDSGIRRNDDGGDVVSGWSWIRGFRRNDDGGDVVGEAGSEAFAGMPMAWTSPSLVTLTKVRVQLEPPIK